MMSFVTISSKGQITLPVKIRSLLGVGPKDKIELLVRGDEIVIQPLRSFRELRGSLPAKKGNPKKVLQETVAQHTLEIDI